MSSLGNFVNALPKRILPKGADAEDGSWQRTGLATGNNILVVVAQVRRAIILCVLMVCLNPCMCYVIAENSAIIFLRKIQAG